MSKNDTNGEVGGATDGAKQKKVENIEEVYMNKHICNYQQFSTSSAGTYFKCHSCGNVKISTKNNPYSGRF